jgi:hypothetical protein
MVKMNKEYSDAFGFRLLGKFTSFLAEHPAEASQIQKICDDGFKATCMKCYPIIVSTGVDPTTYVPKTQTEDSKSIKEQLREMFPLKKSIQPIALDESTSSGDEDETECVVVRTNIITPPRMPAAVAKKIEANLKCADCSAKDKVIEELKKTIQTKDKRIVDLQKMVEGHMKNNDALCSKMDELVKLNKQYSDKLQATKAELEAEKKKSDHRYQVWQNLMKDPDYQAFLEFRKFESFKRKRTQ